MRTTRLTLIFGLPFSSVGTLEGRRSRSSNNLEVGRAPIHNDKREQGMLPRGFSNLVDVPPGDLGRVSVYQGPPPFLGEEVPEDAQDERLLLLLEPDLQNNGRWTRLEVKPKEGKCVVVFQDPISGSCLLLLTPGTTLGVVGRYCPKGKMGQRFAKDYTAVVKYDGDVVTAAAE
jgi:hypothetical protein